MRRDETVILEHPTGELATAADAIMEAIGRVRAQGADGRWAVLSAQGQGAHVDAMRIADVYIRGDALDFGEPVPSLVSIAEDAGLDASRLERGPETRTVRISGASPAEVARLLDGVFRDHFHIRPFDGEDDYAFGAEWSASGPPAAAPEGTSGTVIDLATRRGRR